MPEAYRCEYTRLVPLHELQPNPKNPNAHPGRQIEMLAKIIDYQGQRSPIVVSNRSGFIVKGHGRLEAIQKLGWQTAAVDFQDYENEAQEYADLIADNKIAELADHDDDKMIELIRATNIDDLELFGLDDFELPKDDAEAKAEIEDEVPDVTRSISKLGDVYLLGNHRLVCGDSTDAGMVEILMAGEKADMVFTDPPYGMFLNTNYKSLDNAKGTNFKATNQNYKPVIGDGEDFKPALITTLFDNFSSAKEMFLFGADYYAELLPDRNRGSWVIWDKSVTESMDRGFGSAWESCWSKVRHKRTFARILWRGLYGKKDDQKQRTHPTQKPVHLAEWFFEQWGKETKTVVDVYGGSGSTLIACEKTDRKCFMMELDPHYIDVIVSRWCKYANNVSITRNGQPMEWTLGQTEERN